MKKIILLVMTVMLCGFTGSMKAQFVVADPANLAQGIINTANQIIHTSSTAANMLNNFKEVKKVYEQGV